VYTFATFGKFSISLPVAEAWGTRWRSWLRHCATNRKFAGSIPDGVIWFFHCHNPSGRTMALGSTQPLTEMSTRNISLGVNAAGALGWQPYHLHVPIVLKSGSLSLLEFSGSVQACNGIALPFYIHHYINWCTKKQTIESGWYLVVLSSEMRISELTSHPDTLCVRMPYL